MIRYALTCAAEHRFEAWFRTADDFDAQEARGLLSCPACGDTAIRKALMAPAVSTGGERAAGQDSLPTPVPPGMPATMQAAMATPEASEIIARLRELKAKLLSGSEDVGGRFAEEARRIHYGEAPSRAVHGQASHEDAKALLDEGVGILALPVLPEERN
jgi:hypothetical protein